jgi:ceramide glucosyltransferase
MIFWILFGTGAVYLLLQSIKLLLATMALRRIEGEERACLRDRLLTTHEFNEHQQFQDTAWARDVTVVQPILSGDPQLSETLGKVLRVLPESVYVYWLVDQSDPEALAITRQLAPDASVHAIFESRVEFVSETTRVRILICPDSAPDVNPKSFKLAMALRTVRTNHLVVLDDDTIVDTKTLSTAIRMLDKVALYTGMPRYRRGAGFWSDCVAHFVNNSAALTYLPPLVLFPPISINGMFYAAKTKTLLDVGGFEVIQDSLCDDYALHRLLVTHGLRIYQGKASQEISTSIASVRRYLQLMHRWNLFAWKLACDQPWAIFFYLTLFLGTPPVLLFLLVTGTAISLWWEWRTFLFVCVPVLLMRHALIAAAQWRTFGRSLSMNPWTSIFVEMIQPVPLLSAMVCPWIQWRGRRIRVGAGQRFEMRSSS